MIRSLILLLILSGAAVAQQSAMTFNIRYSTQNDGENWWELRKERVANLVRFYEPDVMGIQEGLHTQVMFLDSVLTRYSFVGVGRDDGATAGEYSALFYKPEALEVLDSGTFWLSETPEKVSVGWDASMERISTWARFRIIDTENEILVFNAHLDHIGPESRLNALRLIYRKSVEWNVGEWPVIIMGDLNATPDAPPIEFLSSVMNDSRSVSQTKPYGPVGTFNGFDISHALDRRIDYIFVDDQITVYKYGVLSDTQNQQTPSDHLPVYISFSIH